MVKKVLLVIVVLLVLGGGAFFARSKGYLFKNSKNVNTGSTSNGKSDTPQQYINFGGDYSFLVPEDYVVDDSSLPGAQLITKKDEKLEVKTLDEIYGKGVIAIQTFSPALTDEESFKNYINKTLLKAIEESLKGKSEVIFGKEGGSTTATIKTSVNGKLVRIQYILNADKPVIIASGAENSAYKTIFGSLAVASKNNKEFTNIQNAIMTCSSLLKNRMSEDLYRLGSKAFKEQTTLDKLKSSLESASVALDTNMSVSGGVLNNNQFFGSLLFTKPAAKSSEQARSAVGAINFEQEDGQWKMSGITLPGKEAFDPPKEE